MFHRRTAVRIQLPGLAFALSAAILLPVQGAAAEDAGGAVLTSVRAASPPLLDGSDIDTQWEAAPPLVTGDRFAEIDITLRSIFTDEEIFFLVTFPDESENREHKTLIWDDGRKVYITGPKREDTFVFKWSMEPFPVDLSLGGDAPYKADIWYWKSYRTNHAGYADDKYQIYSPLEMKKSRKLISKNGSFFYLFRSGDEGEAAYRVLVIDDYRGPTADKYEYATPTGSRADIRARGTWSNGRWTVEFGRRLQTGHPDDIFFDTDFNYQFVVSRYEIAGRKKDPSLEEPLFGSGDGGETITLTFR